MNDATTLAALADSDPTIATALESFSRVLAGMGLQIKARIAAGADETTVWVAAFDYLCKFFDGNEAQAREAFRTLRTATAHAESTGVLPC